MIETEKSRAAFEKASGRKLSAQEHHQVEEHPPEVKGKFLLRNKNKKSRAAYFRAYRKREKKCPHCGKQL